MAIRIDRRIVKCEVTDTDAPPPAGNEAPAPGGGSRPGPAKSARPAAGASQPKGAEPRGPKADVIQMHERLERPGDLTGFTYKVKTPASDHALYVTINDIVLNPGTEHELRRPFEIFINSKNMEHFQWIVALTRIVSAVFRKGGDITFLVEELQSVFDPRGGYWKGKQYFNSLVAEIGSVIERHLVDIGLLEPEAPDAHQRRYLEAKRRELVAAEGGGAGREAAAEPEGGGDDESFPETAELCPKCSTKAVVMLDGCMTCLSCGDSKCN